MNYWRRSWLDLEAVVDLANTEGFSIIEEELL